MAKKTKENLKGLTMIELKKQLAVLGESIRVLKFKAKGAKSKNVKEARTIRKQIARILTFINSQSRAKLATGQAKK